MGQSMEQHSRTINLPPHRRCLLWSCIVIGFCFTLYMGCYMPVFQIAEDPAPQWSFQENSTQRNSSIRRQQDAMRIEGYEEQSVFKKYILSPKFSKILNADAQLIVKSVVEARSQHIPVSPYLPVCKGDLRQYEVEDVLCIPRPKYIPHVKNPCWWNKEKGPNKLQCLPYFHILGCGKCGSTDLYYRISSHPHAFSVNGIKNKEASWWSWGRYGILNYQVRPVRDFNNYTKSFKSVTEAIELSLLNETESRGHRYFITGDGTPSDLMDFRGWPNITQNRGLERPQIITPHLMKHFYANPKFIIIYRDPIERFYSEYFYMNVTLPKSAAQLHEFLLSSIKVLASCIRQRNIRDCVMDFHVYSALQTRLHYVFYSLFITEWFAVFPRENFLILKMEDYSKDIPGTLKKCMDFLGLEPLTKSQMEDIAMEQRKNMGRLRQKSQVKILPATHDILVELVKPTMRVFADIVGDDQFIWHYD